MKKEHILKTFKTTVLKIGEPTITGRVYSKAVVKKALADPHIKQALANNVLFGIFGYAPYDGMPIDQVAFVTEKLYWYKNELRAVISILDTKMGRELLKRLDQVKFVTKGTGDLDGKNVINYTLETIWASQKVELS